MSSAKKIINHLLENDDEDLIRDVEHREHEPVAPTPYDLWIDKYRPILNTLQPDGADGPFDGTMFETFGEELDLVRERGGPNCIWTLVSGDEGREIIVAGMRHVNRLGYFITGIPWEDPTEYVVIDGIGDENA